MRGAEQAERDERRRLRDHEHAVRGAELVPRADAERGARVARERDDDEADQGDRRVAREHDREALAVELVAQQHDRQQPAEPHRGEHEVQPERGDRGVVPCGAGGVALLRHRHQGGHGEHRDERERRVVAHGEAQHGHGGGDERGGEPRLPELDRGDELPELLAERLAEVEGLARDDEEREDAGRGARDREHGGGCRGDVEGDVELAPLRGERPHRQHERADHAGRAQVHEELGDGQAESGDRTGVLDGERRGAAAVREARERREERDGEEHGGAEHADGAGHRTSLDVVGWDSPACRRPRRGARPMPHAPSGDSGATWPRP